MRKSNLDLGVLAGVVERGRSDPGAFTRRKRVAGTLSFAEGTPAYTASMAHSDRATELSVDVARVHDLGDGPLIEQITVTVTVATDVDDQTLARWQQTAREKCPFAFTIINAVPLRTIVRRA